MSFMNDTGRAPEWKMRTTLVGAALGAIAGIVASLMFIQRSEATGKPPEIRKVDPGLALGIGVTLLGLLRQISGLGDR